MPPFPLWPRYTPCGAKSRPGHLDVGSSYYFIVLLSRNFQIFLLPPIDPARACECKRLRWGRCSRQTGAKDAIHIHIRLKGRGCSPRSFKNSWVCPCLSLFFRYSVNHSIKTGIRLRPPEKSCSFYRFRFYQQRRRRHSHRRIQP